MRSAPLPRYPTQRAQHRETGEWRYVPTATKAGKSESSAFRNDPNCRESSIMMHNAEVTGVARLYRAASVLTAGLGVAFSYAEAAVT